MCRPSRRTLFKLRFAETTLCQPERFGLILFVGGKWRILDVADQLVWEDLKMKRYLQLAAIIFLLFVLFEIILTVPRIEAQSDSGFADAWTMPLSPWQDFVVGDKNNGGIGYGDTTGSTRHGGLDVWHKEGDTKTTGQIVYAMADGVVSYRCNSDKNELDCHGFGKAVLVSHNLPPGRAYDGETRVTSVYGHLDASKPIIAPGTPVKKGETIIGYLAPTGNCGSICDFAHLHFGIRKGHYGDPGFPSGGWGYVPISDTNEFSQWIEPIGFIRERQTPSQTSSTKILRTQPLVPFTISVPWVYNFSTCDTRPIKVTLIQKWLLGTFTEVLINTSDNPKASRSNGKFLWLGDYSLKIEVLDNPGTPDVEVEWPPAPNRLACSAETTFPTSMPTATRTSVNTVMPSPLSLPTVTPKPLVVMEERIVYTGTDGNIWLVDPEGRQSQKIDVHGESSFRPFLSPNGQSIVYTCGLFSGHPEVCTVGVDGKNLKRLTSGYDPSWSPDGKQIIFTFGKGGQDTIAFIGADGTNLVVTEIVGYYPIWSPVGNKIAYWGKGPRATDPPGLSIANADGTGRRFLTSVMSSYPSWSPDGNAIIFSCTDIKPPVVCIATTEGTITKISTTANYILGPTFSPDGMKIAFISGENILILDKNGTALRRIASGVKSAVTWSKFVVSK